jgi:hypothetical protein
MQKYILLLVVMALATGVIAQAPQQISYQAVIRNSSNALVTGTAVGMRISLLQGSPSGTPVYVEIQTPVTNANGLVSIAIGNGNAVSGRMSTINWFQGPYYIKTETDITGGTNYTITGTSQVLSIPIAFYADTASYAQRTKGFNIHYIGESYGGGIVFYVYDGGTHGLIAATADEGLTLPWVPPGSVYGRTNLTNTGGPGTGKVNTTALIAITAALNPSDNSASSAAHYCYLKRILDIDDTEYSDWYLPSATEIDLLYKQRNAVGGFSNTIYWSSTEEDHDKAVIIDFTSGSFFTANKTNPYKVRAIRSF